MTAADLPQSVAVVRPEPELISSADRFLASAKASYAVIKTGDEFEAAAIDLQQIKGAQKALEAKRTSAVGPLNGVVKTINEWFKKPADALADAERVIKGGMIGFQNEQERIRREQEAKAAEQLRKERERLEAQAAKAAEKGHTEKAEALQEHAAALPVSVEIASTAPKVSGIAGRSTWQAAVKDKAAFLKYVAEHPEWLNLVDVNMVALNGLARSQKQSLALPGIEAVEVQGISARAA
jgi:colicin import membrane protein